jgi:DNA-binding CsgD family transcriptional regulator
VLRLLAQGASTKEASEKPAITVRTVETYRSRLIFELDVTSVSQLLHYAISDHVVELQS